MIRYATVGTGWITESFIAGADLAGGLELAAVHSRDEARGAAFAAKFGSSPVYDSLERLAADPAVEAVYIASPNSLHYGQSRLFLEAGKHVICEKPATVTPGGFRELAALADARGLVYMEAIMMRHLPARAVLRQALARIGRIRTARFDFSQLSSQYPALLAGGLPNIFNPALATGALMDLGVYAVYAAVDLFGRPASASASAGFLDSGADAYGTAVLDYADKQVTLTYSKIGQSALGSEILGDAGTIAIDSISKLTGMRLLSPAGSEELAGDIPKETLMSGEAAAFARYIRDPASRDDLRDANALAQAVSEVMAAIREKAGIRFDERIL